MERQGAAPPAPYPPDMIARRLTNVCFLFFAALVMLIASFVAVTGFPPPCTETRTSLCTNPD